MAKTSAINKADKNAENINLTYQKRYEKAVNYIDREITKLIDRASLGTLSPSAVKSLVEQIIEQSGYFEITNELLSKGYQDTINESFKMYKGLYNKSFRFSDDTLELFSVRKLQDLDNMTQLSTKLTSDLTNTIVNATVSESVGALTVESAINTTRIFGNNVNVTSDTAMARVYRSSNHMLALDNGIERFIYSGPTSGNIRPFCLAHVGKIKTAVEWNQLENGKGQPKPVMDFQGGYRCRHSFVGVAEEVAEDFEEVSVQVQAEAEKTSSEGDAA